MKALGHHVNTLGATSPGSPPMYLLRGTITSGVEQVWLGKGHTTRGNR
jgi:hypothetical protein